MIQIHSRLPFMLWWEKHLCCSHGSSPKQPLLLSHPTPVLLSGKCVKHFLSLVSLSLLFLCFFLGLISPLHQIQRLPFSISSYEQGRLYFASHVHWITWEYKSLFSRYFHFKLFTLIIEIGNRIKSCFLLNGTLCISRPEDLEEIDFNPKIIDQYFAYAEIV